MSREVMGLAPDEPVDLPEQTAVVAFRPATSLRSIAADSAAVAEQAADAVAGQARVEPGQGSVVPGSRTPHATETLPADPPAARPATGPAEPAADPDTAPADDDDAAAADAPPTDRQAGPTAAERARPAADLPVTRRRRPVVPARLAAPTPQDRRRAAALLAVLLVCGVIGWFAGDQWQTSQDRAEALGGVTASATVIDTRLDGGTDLRATAGLTVRVSNLGRQPFTLTGQEASFDAGEITQVTPRGLAIEAASYRTVVLDVSVVCASPRPLRLPPLQVRGADQVLRSVPVDGSAAALASLCEALTPRLHMVRLLAVGLDGPRLRLLIDSPTGRTTQLLGVSAGGVPLLAGATPSVLDAMGHTVWIDPPADCPPAWTRAGVPRALDLLVDAGGPVTITLDTGLAMPRWLLAGPCAAATR